MSLIWQSRFETTAPDGVCVSGEYRRVRSRSSHGESDMRLQSSEAVPVNIEQNKVA